MAMQTVLKGTRRDSSAFCGPHRHRRIFVGAETLVAVTGLAGTVQLMAGVATPPTSALPFGLSSWVLPGLWLFSIVSLPAAVAGVPAYRRSPNAPLAVLVASATMALEVLVQIPFIEPNPLQAIFGAVALGLGALAWQARRAGWRTGGSRLDR